MKKFLSACFVAVCFSLTISAQIPTPILVSIVKAEDERRYDKTLEDLLKNSDEKIRTRAALAAGRIGDERAIPALVNLLEKDSDAARATAAFALGEIESAKASDAVLKNLANEKLAAEIRARLIEAAGKIAAAQPKDVKTIELGEAILDVLDAELNKPAQHKLTVTLGLTAILRARPEAGDFTAAKFLTNLDARIRGDAANTLSRIRAKNANEQLRALLLADDDANVRANAARALGAAEDKFAFDLLLEAAVSDEDSRVRVSAIRALGNLKDKRVADKLLERAETLLADLKKSKLANSPEKSELLEIAATLGKILSETKDEKVIDFLKEFRRLDKFASPEIESSFAKISPNDYLRLSIDENQTDWRSFSSHAQGLAEIANLDSVKFADERNKAAEKLKSVLLNYPQLYTDDGLGRATPDILRAYARFKTADLPNFLHDFLVIRVPVTRNQNEQTFIRAAAVELLGELSPEQVKFGDFEDSFRIALEDAEYDDALLATIEAIGKQKNERATAFLKDRLYYLSKLNPKYGTSRYLARRRIIALLKDKDAGDFSGKLGVTNSIFMQKDYIRAVSRKNARAILTTDKGIFTIEFTPEAAPLTVDNFISLAKANYFNGLAIHRVVPNFVMQDGDPRGDGNGGPGYSIRCEINAAEYERGAVGMALSGKDTGGSQWFVTHAPQPHLDGGYTVFGRVNETDMKIVDNLVRGDVIRSVKIVEGNAPPKSAKSGKGK